MEINNNCVPQLRFPGFVGEWTMKKLGDYCELRNGYAFKSDSYVNKGRFSIITIANVQNGKLDISAVNSISELPANIAEHQRLKIGDIILSMTGNVGRVCIVDQPNCLLNQRVGLLEQTNTDIVRSFLYCVINSSQFESAMIKSGQGAAQPNISKGDIESFTFFLPPTKVEQQIIADFFYEIDSIIFSQEQKVESLKAHKKGLMQQLFPQSGATTPALRFPGYSGEWEEKTFGELYKKNNIKNDLSFGIDKIISVANMYFKADANIGDKEYLKSYNVFRLGDIAYEGNKSANYAYGRFVENTIGDGIVSHVFDVYSPISKDHCFGYWKYAINYERIMRPVLEKSTIKSTMMTNLIAKDFLKQKTLVPTPAEQQKIAECLEAEDRMISVQEQKVESLKTHKKGLMQQLFPQPEK